MRLRPTASLGILELSPVRAGYAAELRLAAQLSTWAMEDSGKDSQRKKGGWDAGLGSQPGRLLLQERGGRGGHSSQ